MTRRRFGKRAKAAYGFQRNDSGSLFHPSVGAVLLDHLVVDPQQQERGGRLADEQGMNRVKVNAIFLYGSDKASKTSPGRVPRTADPSTATLRRKSLRDDKKERLVLLTGPLPRDKAVVGARNPLATAPPLSTALSFSN